jgi:hypothetical protein
MGRGDRKPIRWAHDRERKHKERLAAKAAAAGAEKKGSKK